MRKYFSVFCSGEDGVETIEFIGVVVVAAVLIGVVAALANSLVNDFTTRGENATSDMNTTLEGLMK